MIVRYFIVFVIIAIVVALLIWKLYNEARDSEPRTKFTESNHREAIRQLDRIQTDPMQISSTEWQDNTRKVIKNYYDKN